jgi:hypothetical protein
MKYCPACNFSFPDFHHVCDFDGTELLSEPQREGVNEARPSRLRPALTSPAFLSVLLAIILLSSAILIGYLESRPLSVAATQPAANSPSDAGPAVDGTERLPGEIRSSAHSWRHQRKAAAFSAPNARREASTTRSVAKRHQSYTPGPSQKAETARSRESQLFSNSSAVSAPPAARPNQGAAKITPPRNTEISASRSSQQVPHQKDPKLTAMLKTTWHVLKKPFSFF